MSIPGLIARPLLPDEFSLFFESREPIPLGRMATFLRKIETEVWPIVNEQGLFLELSEYASGSGEPRFRIVGPGRLSLRAAEDLQRRAVEATERQADQTDKWGRRNFIGAMLVNPVAAAVAASMVSGALNPSAKTIIYQGDVTNVFVATPADVKILSARDIEEGRNRQRTQDQRRDLATAEIARLTHSLHGGAHVKLAGRVQLSQGGPAFRTLSGNTLILSDCELTHRLVDGRGPVVIEAVVVSRRGTLAIEPIGIITGLDDF